MVKVHRLVQLVIVKSAKFSSTSSEKSIERVYYDHDLKAQDAVVIFVQ